MSIDTNKTSSGPLHDIDEWEDDLKRRYPTPDATAFRATDPKKKESEFRDYSKDARPSVREFYRLNHAGQTVEFVRRKRDEYLSLNKRTMSIWEAMEYLNTLIDDSDPDTDVPQIEHLLQTSEAIRRDGHPRWFVLAGVLHDLGKILCLYGEPQWAVVGDTFPVGCQYADSIVFREFFNANPDSNDPRYTSRLGIYEEGCGLDNVMMSWGHDEYLYHVTKAYLPEPALYMLRYHSCYPIHRERAYDYLMNDHDREMFEWVRAFNKYDLYTKSHERPDVAKLRPYYDDLIAEFFPAKIAW